MLVLHRLFFAESFGLVVLVYITVLALTLGVHLPVFVLALSSQAFAAISVVTVVAHPFSEVPEMRVFTGCNYPRLASTLTLHITQ